MKISRSGVIDLQITAPKAPKAVIYDTDIGNDVDDVFALAMLHQYRLAGRLEIKAITISKENRWVGPFIDLMNHRYEAAGIPIGFGRTGKNTWDGDYLAKVCQRNTDGILEYPRTVNNSYELPEAVTILRRTLAASIDDSVTLISVGCATNLARLLQSQADSESPLTGMDLVANKVQHTVIMGGNFVSAVAEFNVYNDVSAATSVANNWPGTIDYVDFGIGTALPYPQSAVASEAAADPAPSPIRDSWTLYTASGNWWEGLMWDPAACLWAVEPKGAFMVASEPGTVSIGSTGITTFAVAAGGRHRLVSFADGGAARTMARVIEWVQATAPTRPSYLPPQPCTLLATGNAGAWIAVEQSGDLSDWEHRTQAVLDTAGEVELFLRNPGHAKRFYRASLSSPPP